MLPILVLFQQIANQLSADIHSIPVIEVVAEDEGVPLQDFSGIRNFRECGESHESFLS